MPDKRGGKVAKSSKITLVAGILVLFFSEAGFCAGSGAYRLEMPDAGPMGMGSAFVAQADRPSAVYYNPAGLIQLKDKDYVSIGVGIIQPFATHKSNSGVETERRTERFVIPHAYAVSDFGLKNFSFGLGFSSYWGLGTEWAGDSFSKYWATKSDLETKDVLLAGAYKINDKLSFGASLAYDSALVNKNKKLMQAGGADGDFQLKGRDNDNWGYRLALLYELNQRHRIGAMYRSPIKVKYRGTATLDNLNHSGADYQTIFGGNTSYSTPFTAEGTLPQSIVLGYCYKPNPKWTFEADLEWMDWASTEQELIIFPNETNPFRVGVLKTGNPAAKDWESVFSFALGTEYKASDTLRLRCGYFYHQSPISDDTFETALTDADSHSVTVGLGKDLNKNMTVDLAYTAMFYEERDINNSVGGGFGANLDGEYSAFSNLYMVTFTYGF